MKFLTRFVSALVLLLGFNAMAQRGYPIYPNEIPYLRFTPSQSVTLASDSFARGNYTYVLVDGEGGASDNLATITGGRAGDLLWIQPAVAGHVITIKNGTGNIYTGSGADYAIPASGGSTLLMFDGANWRAYLPIGTSGPGSGDVVGPAGVTASGDVAVYSGTTGKIIADSKASIDANGVITSGIAGADGGLKMYSEQGATDYLVSLLPNAAMASDALFYMPADEPAAESWLTMGTDGIVDYTTISTETLAAVTGRGATTATATSFTGGATIRVLTVDTATATDDRIVTSVTTGGGARIDGTITAEDLTTSTRTWTFQDASGYVVLDNNNKCVDLEGTGLTLTGGTLNVDDAYLLNNGDTGTGIYDFTGAVLAGASPLVFEGGTADDYETTLGVEDPTTPDKTVTIPNLTGKLLVDTAENAGNAILLGTLDLGKDNDTSTLTIHDAGTIVLYDDGDDTSVTFGPVTDGTTTLGVTGTIDATGLKVGGSAVLTAEADTLATVTGRSATTATSIEVGPVLTGKFDAAAYWTATQADTAKVTFDSVSDGTPGFVFSDPVSVPAGTAAAPTIFFDTDSDTGAYSGGANALAWACAGTTMQTLDGTGLTIGNTSTDGKITVHSAQGANSYVFSFAPHVAMTQNTAYVMPANDGDSGQVLQTNGSGALTWATASSGSSRWTALTITTDFDDDPASTSTITMNADKTASITVGMPIRFTLGGGATNPGTYYAVCTAITSNLLTIAGAPLETDDGDLTALAYGMPEMVQQVDLFVAGAYADATGDILYADMKTKFKWVGTAANLVLFRGMHSTVAATTQPKVNVKVNGAAVSTNDTNNGIQLSTAGTWVDNSAVAINTTNYDIQNGEEIEINVTGASNPVNEALDLTISCVFVRQ